MTTVTYNLRGRIDELTEALLAELVARGLPDEGVLVVRRMLEVELGHERLRPLIEASIGEPAEVTLDRFVVSMDPQSHWVRVVCKN